MLYLKSVGRGANLLLNVPPDTRGLIHENDQKALYGMKQKIDALYQTDLLKPAILNEAGPDKNNLQKKYTWFYLLKSPVSFNGIILNEQLKYGQKIAAATISFSLHGELVHQEKITTVGSQRIIKLPKPMQVTEVTIVVNESKGMPLLKRAKAF